MTEGRSHANRVAWAIHLLSLVSGFLVVLYCNRDQWFFGDEWDFLGHRSLSGAERSLWAPHTEHWSTGPILIYRALYSLYGLRTYTPYVVVLLVLHVAVAHLLWRVLQRAGVDQVIATALAAVFVFLGAGYENLLWAFQIGFIGSVALGFAGLLLVNHDGRWGRRDVGAWGLSVLGLMFSGVSVTMVAVAGLTVLMRRGWRHAALTVSLPGAIYLTWYFVVEQNVGARERTLDDVSKYPAYIWSGLRTAVEGTVGFPGAGAVLVLGLAAFLLRRGGQAKGPAAPAFACALGALMLFAIIATGRAGLGIEQSGASRYTYLVVVLAIPAVGLALAELANGDGLASTGRRAALCALLLLVGVHNVGTLVEQSRVEKRLEQRLKARILAAAQLVHSPAAVLGGNPEPEFSPDIELANLRQWQRDGALPEPGRITREDRLRVATVLQYAVNPEPLATPYSAPLVDGVVGAEAQYDAAGCIRLVPTAPTVELHLVGGEPMSVRVTAGASGEVTGFLRLFTPSVLTGEPHIDKVRAGVPVYVNVTAPVDQVVLRVPASATTEFCGLR